jgi:uncharacterized lipoprotein YehR (DUF1307 family)
MTKPYEIRDEDIEAALRYMKLHVSKNSTKEDAQKMLEDLGSDFHKLALSEPERFLKIKKKIEKRDQSQ